MGIELPQENGCKASNVKPKTRYLGEVVIKAVCKVLLEFLLQGYEFSPGREL